MYKKFILITLLLTSMMHSLMAATVTTNKATYTTTDQVHVHFANMIAKNQDWIGIYPQGSSNAWNNVIGWKWTNDKTNGDLTFGNGALPAGAYEVRVFYNNSFHTEATTKFKVAGLQATVTTSKATYTTNEQVHVHFANMTAKNQDWIGIYPQGSSNAWDNVVGWKWTDDRTNGDLTFGNGALTAGSYEVRVFYNNSFHTEATTKFNVEGAAGPDEILYFDGEHGGLNKWHQYLGEGVSKVPGKIINTGAKGSAHSFRAAKYTAFYHSFNHPAKKLKFLNLDTRIGISSHVGNFGVYMKTKLGDRRMLFDTYMNHPGNDMSGLPPEKWAKPFLSQGTYVHNHPGPTDYYLATRNGNFIHYKINIAAKLKILEPNNELLYMEGFSTSGGDYDNLALSAN